MKILTTKAENTSMDSVREEIEAIIDKRPFKVLAHHDFTESMREKGIDFYPSRALEICSAPLAHQVMSAFARFGQFMPCQINYYRPEENGPVIIESIWPESVAQDIGLEGEISGPLQEVQELLKEIFKEVGDTEPGLEELSAEQSAAA